MIVWDMINGNSRISRVEVPTIYKAYVSGLKFQGIYPYYIWPSIVQYLHFFGC